MNNKDINFFKQYCNECFERFESDIFVILRKTNNKYANLLKERENILNKYPNCRLVIEDKKNVCISESDSKALIKLFEIMDEKKQIESREMFIRGMLEAYDFLKSRKNI